MAPPAIALLACLVVSSCAIAQEPAARAVLDPTGVLAFELGGRSLQLRFPELGWPGPGRHALGVDGLALGEVRGGEFAAFTSGAVDVRRLDVERAEVALSWGDGRTADLAAAVELRRLVPPVVRGGPLELIHRAPFEPAAGDLVFCAIGSAGTGLPGQGRVAASIERLVGELRPDFVLLLGDQFAPDGVSSRSDPKWATRFERVYPADRFPLPFCLALGAAERRGDLTAMLDYARLSPRLTLPASSYTFERRAGDGEVGFFALDTPMVVDSVRNPGTRHARTVISHGLEVSRAGWKVCFGHAPMYSHADDLDTAVAERLRGAMESWLERFGADVYVAGGAHALELLKPRQGVLHVTSGGGGGPEVARSVGWLEDTVFAATGGGSVWFRVRPASLEITFRGVDGDVLFVHRLEKDR